MIITLIRTTREKIVYFLCLINKGAINRILLILVIRDKTKPQHPIGNILKLIYSNGKRISSRGDSKNRPNDCDTQECVSHHTIAVRKFLPASSFGQAGILECPR